MTITIQKAALWKRVSAWIFDMILTITIAIGVAFVTSAAVDYDGYNDKMSAKYQEYEDNFLCFLLLPLALCTNYQEAYMTRAICL